MIKEACVESLIDALEAEKRGANRIELCDNLSQGGTTPSYGTIKVALSTLKIPVFPIIRPRGGDFCYTPAEIEVIKEDIKVCKSLGAKGVVLGLLTKDKKIDFEVLSQLVELAKPMEVTFHKAIDELEDPTLVIDDLINLGVKRILSSGTRPTALEGKDMLNKMVEKAGDRLTIVVAGKVTKENLAEISSLIPAKEYHGKVIV